MTSWKIWYAPLPFQNEIQIWRGDRSFWIFWPITLEKRFRRQQAHNNPLFSCVRFCPLTQPVGSAPHVRALSVVWCGPGTCGYSLYKLGQMLWAVIVASKFYLPLHSQNRKPVNSLIFMIFNTTSDSVKDLDRYFVHAIRYHRFLCLTSHVQQEWQYQQQLKNALLYTVTVPFPFKIIYSATITSFVPVTQHFISIRRRLTREESVTEIVMSDSDCSAKSNNFTDAACQRASLRSRGLTSTTIKKKHHRDVSSRWPWKEYLVFNRISSHHDSGHLTWFFILFRVHWLFICRKTKFRVHDDRQKRKTSMSCSWSRAI